jgi:hypothetical protein
LQKPPKRWLSSFCSGGCFGGCWDGCARNKFFFGPQKVNRIARRTNPCADGPCRCVRPRFSSTAKIVIDLGTSQEIASSSTRLGKTYRARLSIQSS